LYGAGLSVRTSLDERLQAASDKALRDGLIAYDHAHGGWRGAIARIDLKGEWAARLTKVPVPGVVRDVGWQLAVVTRSDTDAAIAFSNGATGYIPFSEMRWARPWHGSGSFGPYPRRAADVVKPGDVVMVQSIPVAASKGEAASAKGSVAFALCQVPEVSGALVAMDPHTGRVLAISGGFSFAISQFDRATQAKRQPGSSIKPFVYLTALDHGFTPSTLVDDAPISLPQGPGLPMWSPTNYARRNQEVRYLGPTPLRVALEKSLNAVTARVASIIGMEAIAQTIERFGIMDHTPREYSMALGAGETTLLRHTAAYAMLDNGGKRITPTFIDRVQDRNGATIFRADNRLCNECSNVEWQKESVPVIPDTRRRQANRRQDRDEQRLAGCVVCRVHPGPRRWRLYRIRRSRQPRRRRDRWAHRGTRLPRLHDRGVEGCAGDCLPDPARDAALPRQHRNRASGWQQRTGDLRGLQTRYRARPEPQSRFLEQTE